MGVKVSQPDVASNAKINALKQLSRQTARDRRTPCETTAFSANRKRLIRSIAFTASGGMGSECQALTKTVAELIANEGK